MDMKSLIDKMDQLSQLAEADSVGGNNITINGKRVDVHSLELDGIDKKDYPDFSDAYFSAGNFEDGTPLSDQELELLADQHGDLVNQLAHDSLHEDGSGDKPEHSDSDQDDKRWDDAEEVEEGLAGEVGKKIASDLGYAATGTARLAGSAGLGAVGGALKGAYTGAKNAKPGIGSKIAGAATGAAKGTLSGAASNVKKTWKKLNADAVTEGIVIQADGEEAMSLLNLLKLSGQKPAHQDFTVDEADDPTYANTPDEETCGMDASTPSGDDLHRSKMMTKHGYQQGDNPLAMAEVAAMEGKLAKMFEALNKE